MIDSGLVNTDPNVSERYNKLPVSDWLSRYKRIEGTEDIIKVHFENTQKGNKINSNNLHLRKGDVVAVEVKYGDDIGNVSLSGILV